MFKNGFFLILVLLFSCTHIPNGQGLTDEVVSPYYKKLVIRPGETRLLKVAIRENTLPSKLICNGNEIIFYQKKDDLIAYVPAPLKMDSKLFECVLTFTADEKEGQETVATFKIMEKEFESEILNVPQKTIDLSKKDLARYLKEKEIIAKAYSNPHKLPLFSEEFTAPLDTFITSSYGRRRVYNNQKENQHGGVDFRATEGTPVPSSNSGKVVLAMDLFFSGKTVLIDHGLGIFTMYAHMSKLKVKVGEYIPRNTIVGLSGMSGRVSGPHLHWGVKVNGIYVDGMDFIKLDF